MLLGRSAFSADAVDPDRLGHGAAVEATLVGVPGEHPEPVWKSFDGTLVCCVPTRQVVNQEVASIDKGEAAKGGLGQGINRGAHFGYGDKRTFRLHAQSTVLGSSSC